MSGSPQRKPMATTAHPAKIKEQETVEQRFRRLRQEARELNPSSIGDPKELERDTLATYNTWAKTRRRANKTA